MTTEIEEQPDNSDLFQKRIELLNGARLRETDRINAAVKLQNNIRAKSGKWSGSKEIAKWRTVR